MSYNINIILVILANECNKSLSDILSKSGSDGSKIHFGSENLISIGIFILFVLYSAIKTGSSSKFSMSNSTERSECLFQFILF